MHACMVCTQFCAVVCDFPIWNSTRTRCLLFVPFCCTANFIINSETHIIRLGFVDVRIQACSGVELNKCISVDIVSSYLQSLKKITHKTELIASEMLMNLYALNAAHPIIKYLTHSCSKLIFDFNLSNISCLIINGSSTLLTLSFSRSLTLTIAESRKSHQIWPDSHVDLTNWTINNHQTNWIKLFCEQQTTYALLKNQIEFHNFVCLTLWRFWWMTWRIWNDCV